MRNNDLFRLMRADFFKLGKHRSVWVGLILSLLSLLFVFSSLWIVMNLAGQIDLEVDGAEDIHFMIGILSASAIDGFSDGANIALLIAIIIGIFVGGEFKNGAIRLLVSRGMSRTKVYISKWLTLAIMTIGYLVIAILFAGVLTAVGPEIDFGSQEIKILVRNFFLQLLSQLSVVSFGVMFGFLLRSKSGAVWSMLGMVIGLDSIFGVLYGLAFTGINTDWIMFMPLQQLAVASSTTRLTTLQLIAVTVMPTIYIALTTFLGIYSFNKRDIK